MTTEQVKLKAGGYWIKATLSYEDDRIFISFPYNKPLLATVKALQGAKWHGFDTPPRKVWSIPISQRNMFRLALLRGIDSYAEYDRELLPYTSTRTLRDHQLLMVRHCLTRRCCILAGEMGTGKSLVAIEVMDYLKEHKGLLDHEAWYIGPKAGVRAVSRELAKWQAKVKPLMMTYEAFTKLITEWKPSNPLPKIIVFDESSKLKTPTSKRTQAALHLRKHLDNCYIIEMTGTPAPKTPVDWWSQCEIACPGFLTERDIFAMKHRLSLIEERKSLSGGVYPHIVTWLDDEKKCAKCGEKQEHANHDVNASIFGGDASKIHDFVPSVNEVHKLYSRLNGLVQITWKKDCLQLPEKQYQIVKVPPTKEILRAAQLIRTKCTRAVTAFTLLRELSDGFQYTETVIGERECPECHGTGTNEEDVPIEMDITKAQDYSSQNYVHQTITCVCCEGKKVVPVYQRSSDSYESPKDQVFIDYLDEFAEIGRFVVWGGFTGTIDRLIEIARKEGWAVLRYDQQVAGIAVDGSAIDTDDLLDAMDNSHPRYKELKEAYPKVCFIGHPDAGGMALTLHASPVALYYSNSFKGESRIQSEDRIHRMGMDANRGCTIIDLVLLKSDLIVLDNLKQKKKLQNLTMNVLSDAFTDSTLGERDEC